MIRVSHKKLGCRIKQLRKEQKISREELAFRSDVSAAYIGMIERGEKDLKFSKLVNISNGLEIPLTKLVDFN
jgi:transcriptional regulator with XRE-family HTH domain